MTDADQAGKAAVTDDVVPAIDKSGVAVAAEASAEAGSAEAVAAAAGASAGAGDASQTAEEPSAPAAEAPQEAPGETQVTQNAAPEQAQGATAVEGDPDAVPAEGAPPPDGKGAQKADEGASEVAPQADQAAAASAAGQNSVPVEGAPPPDGEGAKKAAEGASEVAPQADQAAAASAAGEDAVPVEGTPPPDGEGAKKTDEGASEVAPQTEQAAAAAASAAGQNSVPVEGAPPPDGEGAKKVDEGASEVAPQADRAAAASAAGEEPQAVQETALPQVDDETKESEKAAREAAQSEQDAAVPPGDVAQTAKEETPQAEGLPETGGHSLGEATQVAQELAAPETDGAAKPTSTTETPLTAGEVTLEAAGEPPAVVEGSSLPAEQEAPIAAAEAPVVPEDGGLVKVGQEAPGTALQPDQGGGLIEESKSTKPSEKVPAGSPQVPLEGERSSKDGDAAPGAVPQATPQEPPAAQEVMEASGEGDDAAEAAQSGQEAAEHMPTSAMSASQDQEEPAAAQPDSSEPMQKASAALAGHALQVSGEESTETAPAASTAPGPAAGGTGRSEGGGKDDISHSPTSETPIGVLAPDGDASDAKAISPVTEASPQKSNRKSLKTKPESVVQDPGVVVYVVAPMVASEATLTNDEFAAVSATALRSDASVVLSARNSESVVALDPETADVDRVLRPLAEFAISRFRSPGSSKAGPQRTAFAQLFDALVQPGRSEVSVEALAQGLHALGYRGNAEAAAEATLGEGLQRVSRQDFCDSLSRASELPQIVAISAANQASLTSSLKSKKRNSQSESSHESSWPMVTMVPADDFELAGDTALQTKVDEAVRIAGPAGYGVVLLLTGRGRTLLRPTEYERQMRAELQFAAEGLPSDWPLLWYPGPAEVGFLPAGNSPQRPNWAMPQASRPEDLQGWLRYLLSVRPKAPVT
eukprot:TRINITY_DN3150_c0_g1_i2.p1 TRINITY_DN3150_c0_g1~~TRINITY_DN3150_c0_g1_i2.p1  ORF type:complete len:931 (+),score=227.95 TRINITY_DN3150_c0_g1_i2:217-3009(+)